jgi:hypothetical protein
MFSGGLVEPTITVAAEAGDFVRAPMASINRRNRNPMRGVFGESPDVHHALWNRRPRGAAYRPSCRRRRGSNNRLVRANKTSELVIAFTLTLTPQFMRQPTCPHRILCRC